MADGADRSIFGERGSLRQAMTLPLALGVLSLMVASTPLLLSGRGTLKDVFVGAPFEISTILASLAFLFTFTIRGMRNRIEAGRSPKPFFFTVVGGYLLLGLGIISCSALADRRLAIDLNDHGVVAQARLLRTYLEACGKRGCSTGVEYEFTPKGSRHPVKGTANEGIPGRSPGSESNYIVTTRTVPILYDPSDPSRSMVYWHDDIRREASWSAIAFTVGLLGGLLSVAVMILSFIMWAAMRDLTTMHAAAKHAGEGSKASSADTIAAGIPTQSAPFPMEEAGARAP